MLTKVNGKTALGDIMRYPPLVNILQDAGLQLVGCSLPLDMSLRRFFKAQGLPSDKLDSSLSRLNEAIEELHTQLNTDAVIGNITITEMAAEKITQFLKQKNELDAGLRITVVPGGCSGYQYYLKVDKAREDYDVVFSMNGAHVIVAKADIPLVDNSILDFKESLTYGGGGFMLDNPNARSTCACGQSFA
ncbi:MAG: HesB/IscA family protein [Candidatus Thorarchaeota archaeon]